MGCSKQYRLPFTVIYQTCRRCPPRKTTLNSCFFRNALVPIICHKVFYLLFFLVFQIMYCGLLSFRNALVPIICHKVFYLLFFLVFQIMYCGLLSFNLVFPVSCFLAHSSDGFCAVLQAREYLSKLGDLSQTQIFAKIENVEV